MTAKLAVSIGVFALLLTASDAFANGWFGSGGSSGGSKVAFGSTSNTSNGGGNTYNQTSVPEPSSLYAVGTALALLGGAGWILRRK